MVLAGGEKSEGGVRKFYGEFLKEICCIDSNECRNVGYVLNIIRRCERRLERGVRERCENF
jgi:hypothetical protein